MLQFEFLHTNVKDFFILRKTRAGFFLQYRRQYDVDFYWYIVFHVTLLLQVCIADFNNWIEKKEWYTRKHWYYLAGDVDITKTISRSKIFGFITNSFSFVTTNLMGLDTLQWESRCWFSHHHWVTKSAETYAW